MQRISVQEFNEMKSQWREEIKESLVSMKSKTTYSSSSDDESDDLVEKRKLELEHARDIREMYEKKLTQLNEMYDEVNNLLASLREREAELKKIQQENTKF
jgi:hypothetical protein